MILRPRPFWRWHRLTLWPQSEDASVDEWKENEGKEKINNEKLTTVIASGNYRDLLSNANKKKSPSIDRTKVAAFKTELLIDDLILLAY